MRSGRCHWKRSLWANIDFTMGDIVNWFCVSSRHFRTTFIPLPYCFSSLQESFRNNFFFLFHLSLVPSCTLDRYLFQNHSFYFLISFSIYQSIPHLEPDLFFFQEKLLLFKYCPSVFSYIFPSLPDDAMQNLSSVFVLTSRIPTKIHIVLDVRVP